MSEYAQYYEAFCTSYWARENAEECRCHGGGWALSEVDTWHRCPIHGQGVPHPDDAEADENFADWAKANPEEAAKLELEAQALRDAAAAEAERWKNFITEDDVPF